MVSGISRHGQNKNWIDKYWLGSILQWSMRHPGPTKLLVHIICVCSFETSVGKCSRQKEAKEYKKLKDLCVWAMCPFYAARHSVLLSYAHFWVLKYPFDAAFGNYISKRQKILMVIWHKTPVSSRHSEEEMQGNLEAIGKAISALKKGLAGLTFPVLPAANVGWLEHQMWTVGRPSDSSDQLWP